MAMLLSMFASLAAVDASKSWMEHQDEKLAEFVATHGRKPNENEWKEIFGHVMRTMVKDFMWSVWETVRDAIPMSTPFVPAAVALVSGTVSMFVLWWTLKQIWMIVKFTVMVGIVCCTGILCVKFAKQFEHMDFDILGIQAQIDSIMRVVIHGLFHFIQSLATGVLF